MRRLKAGLFRVSSGDGVSRVVRKLRGKTSPMFSERWMVGDKSARDESEKLLKSAGLSMEDVMAEVLSNRIDDFERIDRMIASSEARRNTALREVDRHRETLGSAMRPANNEVQDAEFRDLETGEGSGGPRS